jgi:hypothetical protein
MAEKKTTTKKAAGKKTVSSKPRAGNSAATARKRPLGRPFTPGNPYAFKPGQSGNPAGRPRDTITPYLRVRVQQVYPGRDATTYGEMIANELIDLAVAGEIAAIREVCDRLEGKPRQAVDLTSDDKARALVENAIATLMIEAGIDRDEAERQLTAIAPEVSKWVN